MSLKRSRQKAVGPPRRVNSGQQKPKAPPQRAEQLVPVRVTATDIASGLRAIGKLPAIPVAEVVRIEALGVEGYALGPIDELRIWYRPVLEKRGEESGVGGQGKKPAGAAVQPSSPHPESSPRRRKEAL